MNKSNEDMQRGAEKEDGPIKHRFVGVEFCGLCAGRAYQHLPVTFWDWHDERITYLTSQARKKALEEAIAAIPPANNPANCFMNERREGENWMRNDIIKRLHSLSQ